MYVARQYVCMHACHFYLLLVFAVFLSALFCHNFVFLFCHILLLASRSAFEAAFNSTDSSSTTRSNLSCTFRIDNRADGGSDQVDFKICFTDFGQNMETVGRWDPKWTFCRTCLGFKPCQTKLRFIISNSKIENEYTSAFCNWKRARECKTTCGRGGIFNYK